jgi:hypothetical protein
MHSHYSVYLGYYPPRWLERTNYWMAIFERMLHAIEQLRLAHTLCRTNFQAIFDNVVADYLWARAVILTSPTVATVGLSLTIPLAFISDFFVGTYLRVLAHFSLQRLSRHLFSICLQSFHLAQRVVLQAC